MKKCLTCPELTRLPSTTLPKVQSLPSLPRVKSQASIGLIESIPDISSYDNAYEVIQDISDPKGLASIICLEHYGKVDAPILKSKDTEELEGCLYTPTEEDTCGADAIWRKVMAADANNTFVDYHSRRRRWHKILKAARGSVPKK